LVDKFNKFKETVNKERNAEGRHARPKKDSLEKIKQTVVINGV